ncbi:hypothetical protein PTTG_09779 [Puccinia triticina 1-1 BBBD Race 1]|uniref:Uncharacterized protein n=2 Tax=Puccinia triticina TaxID=208348 RepID=A0A0C4F9A9_PUCT1|nr:uncharacterized protein PtA15_6A280 [Puccinia triticina]OAV96986.1 hypothetical protein PTTG_09779 [Puccinia triticina 1-1 BBBD Race 1]WAQ85652.1 hypothetical protein PtA15_6A280 [Puccinia triticina]WAR55532.1 hypothetical protein PtB15_6B273 [Puccinia triticina]
MDTDWCIVCDNRIHPSMPKASKVSKTSGEITEVGGSSAVQSSSSAFCSTSCLVKAYQEAELRSPSNLSPQTFNIQYPISLHSARHGSSPIPPNHQSCIKNQPKSASSDFDSQRLKTKPHERTMMSQFTFGSYGTSSLSSSESLL